MTSMSHVLLYQLPSELLTLIVDFLPLEDLKQLRLTCRLLEAGSKRVLFRNVFLSPDEEHLRRWNSRLNDRVLCELARKVTIRTCIESHSYYDSEDDYGYNSDEEADFSKAVQQLVRLKEINSVCIEFALAGMGKDDDNKYWRQEFQTMAKRAKTLELVFRAIQKHASQKDGAPIRELTLDNLQSCPIDFVVSELFRSVMGKLDHLHVGMVNAHCDHDPFFYVGREEQHAFPPHFTSQWLAPISANLVSLTLYSNQNHWSPFLGCWDFSDVSFPKLETLSLGQYMITSDDQIDWILAQKSLKKLVMQKCTITPVIQIEDWKLTMWDFSTRDWKVIYEDSIHTQFLQAGTWSRAYDKMFLYAGTWSQFFEKITDSLPNLLVFCFDYQTENLEYPASVSYALDNINMPLTHLEPRRYSVYQGEYCFLPEADCEGELNHTLIRPFPIVQNFHNLYLRDDKRSFDKLLQKCRDRGNLGV